jgi:hypothetical protein
MVSTALWNEAGMGSGFLCVGCLERRLGRLLCAEDLTGRLNEPSPADTPRLRHRKARRLRARYEQDCEWA